MDNWGLKEKNTEWNLLSVSLCKLNGLFAPTELAKINHDLNLMCFQTWDNSFGRVIPNVHNLGLRIFWLLYLLFNQNLRCNQDFHYIRTFCNTRSQTICSSSKAKTFSKSLVGVGASSTSGFQRQVYFSRAELDWWTRLAGWNFLQFCNNFQTTIVSLRPVCRAVSVYMKKY